MLSYQHAYHAGSYADVLKHLTLLRIFSYLTQKESPLFYLETHAGRGRYNLQDAYAQKTGEAKEGIEKLWQIKANLPPVFHDYLRILESVNESQLSHYLGSPALAVHLARPQDRLFACELHSGEFENLKKMPRLQKKLHLECVDGIEMLSSLLPPPEKRGLIFIDPAYEVKSEYTQIPKAIRQAYNKFKTGVYVLWYPIVADGYHQKLLSTLDAIGAEKTLRVELHLHGQMGMRGTGLYILNPPYTLKKDLEVACETFKTIFNDGKLDVVLKNSQA